jgi:hypothetical protein
MAGRNRQVCLAHFALRQTVISRIMQGRITPLLCLYQQNKLWITSHPVSQLTSHRAAMTVVTTSLLTTPISDMAAVHLISKASVSLSWM